jgi:DNA-binding NarL/FixJ family response regulator
LLNSGTEVDVVILDVTLPGQSGIELLKTLRRDRPDLQILVLSMHPERSFAVRLMRAGANGYVPKMIVPEELVRAVRAVGSGRRYITPIVAELLASEAAAEEDGPLHNRLSERELQVFTRIARGVSPAVMANELGLSVKTVSTYRARILEKMGMRSNAEIAAYAVRNQLVD